MALAILGNAHESASSSAIRCSILTRRTQPLSETYLIVSKVALRACMCKTRRVHDWCGSCARTMRRLPPRTP